MTSLSADPANTIPGLGLCRYIATLVMRWAEPAVHFSRRALPGTQNRTRGGVRRKESALPSSRKIRRYWIGEKIRLPSLPPSPTSEESNRRRPREEPSLYFETENRWPPSGRNVLPTAGCPVSDPSASAEKDESCQIQALQIPAQQDMKTHSLLFYPG